VSSTFHTCASRGKELLLISSVGSSVAAHFGAHQSFFDTGANIDVAQHQTHWVERGS
jgi:hypothetical protein